MRTWPRLFAALASAALLAACTTSQQQPSPVAGTSAPQAPADLTAPCTGVSLSASQRSPITAGTLVVFLATAGGCPDPQFRFVVTDASGTSGSVGRDWDFTPSWSWSTYTLIPGQYLVRADVRTIGQSAPAASTYLTFIVLPGTPPSVLTCRLPVSGTVPGSGGFIQMPDGKFTADPASQVNPAGQPDLSGLRRGLTYDPVHGEWLPVPRDWVMPDFSSYVYVGTEYPRVSNQPALHLVKLPSGVDTMWTNGDQLYGYPIALRPEGVYGAPGPQIITMVDPAGAVTNVDQGHLGLYAVIGSDVIWATRSDQDRLAQVQRIDPKTQAVTDWFTVAGLTVLPIGVDADGNPIIAAGRQLPSGQIAATQVWIVPLAGHGRLIYSDASAPLTIVGWPIVSASAIWIETDKGLWLDDGPTAQMHLVSSHSGYIAGGCL